MTFFEKVHKLLETNELVNTLSALEAKSGVSAGALTKPYKAGTDPGAKVMKKIKEFFGNEWDQVGHRIPEDALVKALQEISTSFKAALSSNDKTLEAFREDKKSELHRIDIQLANKDALIMSLQEEKKELMQLFKGSKP